MIVHNYCPECNFRTRVLSVCVIILITLGKTTIATKNLSHGFKKTGLQTQSAFLFVVGVSVLVRTEPFSLSDKFRTCITLYTLLYSMPRMVDAMVVCQVYFFVLLAVVI